MPKKENKLVKEPETKEELVQEDLEKVAGGTDPAPTSEPEEQKTESREKKPGDITLPEIP